MRTQQVGGAALDMKSVIVDLFRNSMFFIVSSGRASATAAICCYLLLCITQLFVNRLMMEHNWGCRMLTRNHDV
jgi:hypothetical protein